VNVYRDARASASWIPGIADGLLGGIDAEDGDSELAFRNPDSLGEPARPIPAMSDQPSVRWGVIRTPHA
jgi:hypothetical protein